MSSTPPSTVKQSVCGRLVRDWDKVADYFNVSADDRVRFGESATGLWDWLDQRDRLAELKDAFASADRADLVALLDGPPWDAAPSRPVSPAATRLPARPACFGREDEIRRVVEALTAADPVPVPVLGPGGAGKTTLCLVALREEAVVTRFGPRRFFVRCDGSKTAEALLNDLAVALGVVAGESPLEARVLAELEAGPAALLVDNFETPWEADTLKVEELLAKLAAVPGLAVAVTMRGEQRPFGVRWRDPVRVPMLPLPAAREAFLEVAGKEFAADPDLDRLLEAVDRLPLAVTLLGYLAQGEPRLADLYARWQQERTEMLRRVGAAGDRLSNAAVSFELSIRSPRMTDDARRLLSVLGVLPDGIRHDDLAQALPKPLAKSATDLRRVGLAYDDVGRLRVLAPVRDHVARAYPPADGDFDGAADHYLHLVAKEGNKAGGAGGAEAIVRVSMEMANVAVAVGRKTGRADAATLSRASRGLCGLGRFAGFDVATLLTQIHDAVANVGNNGAWAECIKCLGNLALARSDHDAARGRYEEALPLFRRVGDLQGEATCIKGLGNLALRRSDHDAARCWYEEALHLFRRVGDVRGEANCIRNLGDLALRRRDRDAARGRYEEALPLFRRVGDVRGEANCVWSWGDLALAQSDHDAARGRYEEALPLFRRVGDVQGEANCVFRLGDLALRRSDHDVARGRYEEALPLFRRFGSVLGEANCVLRLGEIDRMQSRDTEARARYDEALRLYEHFGDPYSIGWARFHLMRVATNDADRDTHREAARRSWKSVKRDDLIRNLLDPPVSDPPSTE